MKTILLEILYIMAGLVALFTAYLALQDKKHPTRLGSTIFWALLAFAFIFGKYVPAQLVAVILIVMGVLTALNKVQFGSQKNSSPEFRQEKSNNFKNKLFIPALSIAVFAFGIAQFTSLGGLVGLGIGAFVATIIALVMTGAEASYVAYDGSRLLQQVGSASILPQLLAALGSLFAAAGVGDVIASSISGVIPQGNILLGVIAYCLGMALFTIIMGNAFAAFAVITAGIGMPFVYSQGADPAVAGALALTAGYCGTLMTPMAANFNIVPAAILETNNQNRVIISQFAFALVMLFIHIILMYWLAF
ncbi:DUF979 domain-containing protein [Halanaerobium salsuginis]|jgi:uncharacterized membrane protein|uniref:Uncharacterized membrane protein n=1 Tax=Halanaerobium salsuginis TaxID=29563 RepID=A0A1I4IQR6_9FIRM|nr:DUF979 domain-containing protein [Halanaerobium salsuginis]SFL56333.1 Uncharacterized membrane protein [Halanaerobium salsuginis]